MIQKSILITLVLIALSGCTSTAPKQKLTPEELSAKIDDTVVNIVRMHKKFGTTCSVINEEVKKTDALNKENGTNKHNDVFNYTTGVQALMITSYPIDFQLARSKRLISAYGVVKDTCTKNPAMPYADALQEALLQQQSS